MWSDNASTEDFLNFGVIASVIADTVKSNGDAPLSIGVSGAWGVGKSSTLELLSVELKQIDPEPIVVCFQPWRHQNQDNVRAAFAECIANAISESEGIDDKIKSKAKSIAKRANLMRIAGYGLGGALTLATGLPLGGLIGRGVGAIGDLTDGDISEEDVENATTVGQASFAHLFPKGESSTQSPYENIEKICKDFGDALEDLDRRLIVLVDDLDRCLPATTIEALEAMRLYFFVPKTVFIIAADEEMLRLAVRKHFEVSGQTLAEKHLQSYYDKLIQLPFRLPSLTEPDVVVYMTMLIIEQQERICAERRGEIRDELCQILGRTWTGERVSRQAIMATVDNDEIESDFENRIAMVERLAPRLVESKYIGGNPRLIKRFMNSLSIRRSLAQKLEVPNGTNESVLAKVLLMQRCGEPGLLKELEMDVLSSVDGKSPLLRQLENQTADNSTTDGEPNTDDVAEPLEEIQVSELWQSPFAKEWVKIAPPLADTDLRAAIHVSRGADQVFVQAVKLSPESVELLEALIEDPSLAGQHVERIKSLPGEEAATIMSTIIDRMASSPQPEIKDWLNCCVEFSDVHSSQQTLLVSSLRNMNERRWEVAHVIAIRDKPYANDLRVELAGKLPSDNPVMRAFRST